MRLKINLNYLGGEPLPINYNYFLSSALYNLLDFGKPEFAAFLHNKGYNLNGRSYKLFTFSLLFEKYSIADNKINLLSPKAYIYVSSPIIDEFLKGLVIGAFRMKEMRLMIQQEEFIFEIEQMEEVPPPTFTAEMNFKLLSPLVLSTYETDPTKNQQYYLRFSDDLNIINRVFNNNLKNKYKIIHQKEYTGEDLSFKWDNNYINRMLSKKKRIVKKIPIYSKGRPIYIIANNAPFKLSGSPELIELGYETSYGEKNSMGFGMAAVVN